MTQEEKFFNILCDQFQQPPAAKKQRVDDFTNRDREKDLVRKLSALAARYDVSKIVEEAGLSAACAEVLEEVTIKIIINIYCCDGVGTEPNPQMFKSEMEAFGISKLDAIKLNVFLRKIYSLMLKAVNELPAIIKCSLYIAMPTISIRPVPSRATSHSAALHTIAVYKHTQECFSPFREKPKNLRDGDRAQPIPIMKI
jgi:hypothetical protein